MANMALALSSLPRRLTRPRLLGRTRQSLGCDHWACTSTRAALRIAAQCSGGGSKRY